MAPYNKSEKKEEAFLKRKQFFESVEDKCLGTLPQLPDHYGPNGEVIPRFNLAQRISALSERARVADYSPVMAKVFWSILRNDYPWLLNLCADLIIELKKHHPNSEILKQEFTAAQIEITGE